MAWTPPKTWIPGETVDAAGMNLHVKANLDWLYANAPRASISAPDYCLVERQASESHTNSVAKSITYDTQLLDSNGMFAPSSQTITIQTTGVYICVFRMGWAASTAGVRFTGIYVNSTLKCYSTIPDPTDEASGVSRSITFLGPISLVATDTISTYSFQNSGGALGTRTTAGQVPQLLVVQVS